MVRQIGHFILLPLFLLRITLENAPGLPNNINWLLFFLDIEFYLFGRWHHALVTVGDGVFPSHLFELDCHIVNFLLMFLVWMFKNTTIPLINNICILPSIATTLVKGTNYAYGWINGVWCLYLTAVRLLHTTKKIIPQMHASSTFCRRQYLLKIALSVRFLLLYLFAVCGWCPVCRNAVHVIEIKHLYLFCRRF